jgi:hypothetical protein
MLRALRTTITRAPIGAFALLCALVSAFAGGETQSALVVALGDGRFVVARPAGTGTAVSIYSACESGIVPRAQITVPDRLVGLSHKAGGRLALAWSRHAAYLISTDASSPRPLWRTDRQLLQVAEVAPPGHAEPLVLALCAEGLAAGHYRESHLTLLDPTGKLPPRELSPESGYNFWAVSVADVDGDGAEDVGLCTYSRTARDPRYAQRFFVYSWDETGDLYPRWRGSRLCRPYLSAAVMPVNGVQLVSRETGLGGGTLLVSYTWNQFGFWGLGHTEEYADIGPPQTADVNGDGRAELVAVIRDHDEHCRAVAFGHDGERWSPVAQSALVPPGSQIVAVPARSGDWVCLVPTQPDAAPLPLPLVAVPLANAAITTGLSFAFQPRRLGGSR